MDFDKVVLGRKYTDKVTGFTGTATGKAEYLYDKPVIQVESLVDGVPESRWFNVERIEPERL